MYAVIIVSEFCLKNQLENLSHRVRDAEFGSIHHWFSRCIVTRIECKNFSVGVVAGFAVDHIQVFISHFGNCRFQPLQSSNNNNWLPFSNKRSLNCFHNNSSTWGLRKHSRLMVVLVLSFIAFHFALHTELFFFIRAHTTAARAELFSRLYHFYLLKLQCFLLVRRRVSLT